MLQLWEHKQTNRQTDGRYQVHYLPTSGTLITITTHVSVYVTAHISLIRSKDVWCCTQIIGNQCPFSLAILNNYLSSNTVHKGQRHSFPYPYRCSCMQGGGHFYRGGREGEWRYFGECYCKVKKKVVFSTLIRKRVEGLNLKLNV